MTSNLPSGEQTPIAHEDHTQRAVAQMERRTITEIYSYDEYFDMVPEIQRLEP